MGKLPPQGTAIVSRLERLARRRCCAVPWASILAVTFLSPLWREPLAQGHGDWLWFHFAWDAARRSLVTFGEPLYWNAYYCGGNFGLANPQSFALSPALFLLWPLPTAIALKAFLTICVFLGAWGMWELCRLAYPRGSGLGALLAAATFACSGALGWHMNGQLAMANMQLYPWVFWLLLQGRARPSRAFGAGSLLGVMLLDCGVYPAILGCVGVAIFTLVSASVDAAARDRARLGTTLRAGLLAAIAMPTTAAVMLVPVADVLRDHRRPVPVDDAIPLSFVPRMLLERHTTETQIFARDGLSLLYAWWGEYGNYVGVVGVCLLGAALVFVRGAVRERLTALVLFAFLLGDHGPWSPFGAFRRLPLLGSLRVPTRYWPLITLFVALTLSVFVDQVLRRLRRVRAGSARTSLAIAGLAVACFFVVDLVRTNGIAVHAGAMPNPPAPADEPFVAFHQVLGRAWPMTEFPPKNQGTLRCFDELYVGPAPGLRPGLPSELYLDDPSAGQVRVTGWTPSEIRFVAELIRPTTAVYNQSYYRGWRAEGATITPTRGLIAADLSPGTHTVRFFHRPVGLPLGASVSALAFVALLVLWWRDGQGCTNTNVP